VVIAAVRQPPALQRPVQEHDTVDEVLLFLAEDLHHPPHRQDRAHLLHRRSRRAVTRQV
jgi:hypothetical protein